jgi:hypothetical protein
MNTDLGYLYDPGKNSDLRLCYGETGGTMFQAI